GWKEGREEESEEEDRPRHPGREEEAPDGKGSRCRRAAQGAALRQGRSGADARARFGSESTPPGSPRYPVTRLAACTEGSNPSRSAFSLSKRRGLPSWNPRRFLL